MNKGRSTRGDPPVTTSNDAQVSRPPKDGLLCAMVLVPRTYARNRFFRLFDDPEYAHLRKRAKAVRGLIRELLGTGARHAEVVGTQVLDDLVLLRIQVVGLNYERTTSLSPLEAALVSFATCRARSAPVPTDDAALVLASLSKLGENVTNLVAPETRPPR